MKMKCPECSKAMKRDESRAERVGCADLQQSGYRRTGGSPRQNRRFDHAKPSRKDSNLGRSFFTVSQTTLASVLK